MISLTEQYVSPSVLPMEPFVGWIKWNRNDDYKKIVLRYDIDCMINKLFNVDESIFQLPHEKGIIEIPTSLLQLDGFFGFGGFYQSKPESNWELSFAIDFVGNNDEKQTLLLSTTVIRPNVEIVASTYDEINISRTSPILPPISFLLKNKEAGTRIVDPTLVIDVNGTKDLQIKIAGKMKLPRDDVIMLDDVNLQPIDEIKIKGNGNALIRFILEYKDDANNKYSTTLKEIPLFAENVKAQVIPITHKIQTEEAILIAA